MRGIIEVSVQDASTLLQFGILKVGKVRRSISDVPKGFMGVLLEVETRNIVQHLLHKEDCYAVAVPLNANGETITYGPIYATSKSVILRTDVKL